MVAIRESVLIAEGGRLDLGAGCRVAAGRIYELAQIKSCELALF
jgi:hypothetical protein